MDAFYLIVKSRYQCQIILNMFPISVVKLNQGQKASFQLMLECVLYLHINDSLAETFIHSTLLKNDIFNGHKKTLEPM